ncbi:hypothetical protein TSAR_000318 [Trichomalopsis sarcophagae]|uniref:Uncharacterized protein n=1 Tax=Trichomalopsis sarcophagae TaxID=543379 RepID=A0A232ES53_9HYME|nr:hypothetical protein TSAR_000318 [Trichomalopsis sarcophagae]
MYKIRRKKKLRARAPTFVIFGFCKQKSAFFS